VSSELVAIQGRRARKRTKPAVQGSILLRIVVVQDFIVLFKLLFLRNKQAALAAGTRFA
jgi:hypothetical protein